MEPLFPAAQVVSPLSDIGRKQSDTQQKSIEQIGGEFERLQEVDERRRVWVNEWIESRGLPLTTSGSYYVKAFRPIGELPPYLAPLRRGDVVRIEIGCIRMLENKIVERSV